MARHSLIGLCASGGGKSPVAVASGLDAEIAVVFAGIDTMGRAKLTYTFLTAVGVMYTTQALAASRCVADLGRKNKDFCINADHAAGKTPLAYQWKMNDDIFDLQSRICISDQSGIGAYRDTMFALDRSQSIWGVDASLKKVGADEIATVIHALAKIKKDSEATPNSIPKVGVTLFSTAPDCREYAGGPLTVDREFPCVFVPARPVNDSAHYARLLELLSAAKGRYSQGGLSRSGDLGIVADLLKTDRTGLGGSRSGVVLFSDARSYFGASGDVYAYLRSANYAAAETEIANKFSALDRSRYLLVFALGPTLAPALGTTHLDAYDTMCAIQGASPTDCLAANQVVLTDPKTWPVNRLDAKSMPTKLATLFGGDPAKAVITLDDKAKIEPGLELLRQKDPEPVSPDKVELRFKDGTSTLSGVIAPAGVSIEGIPARETIDGDLVLTVGQKAFQVPVAIKLGIQPKDGALVEDAEMVCQAGVAPATVAPKVNLANLQGGSASCGVVGRGVSRSGLPLALMMLFPALAAGLLAARRRSRSCLPVATLLLLTVVLPAGTARSEDDSQGGLNSLQYRPLVDGAGSAETATTIGAGRYNAGLFVDYANDAVELGGEGNKRLRSVVDDSFVAHAIGTLGLHEKASLSLHVPYVQRTDIERSVNGDEVEGGSLGQPADVGISVKINLVQRSRWALALIPAATAPTGDEKLLIGDGTANYGMLLAISGTNGIWTWAYNGGYMHREEPLDLQDDRANEIKVKGQAVNYAGVSYRIVPRLSVAGGMQVKISAGEKVDLTRSNPAEWMLSGNYRVLSGLGAFAGVGSGIGKGYGSPDYRAVVGATWVPGVGASPSGRTSVAGR